MTMPSTPAKAAEANPSPRPDLPADFGRPEIFKPLWGNPVTWLRRKLSGKSDAS
jgi:hypothetical protein